MKRVVDKLEEYITLELKLESSKVEKEVESLVTSDDKVTEEKVEESLNYDLLTEKEKKAIEELE